MNKAEFFAWINKILKTNFKAGEAVNLSDDQKATLNANSKTPDMAEKVQDFLNAQNHASDAITANVLAFLAENTTEDNSDTTDDTDDTDETEETTADNADESTEANTNPTEKLLAKAQKQAATIKKQQQQLAILKAQPEDDTPQIVGLGQTGTTMKLPEHTKSALFGSNESFMAFENRSWNKNLKAVLENGMGEFKASSFTTLDIETIKEDIGAFNRKHDDTIRDFFHDHLSIPKHWKVVSGVADILTNLTLYIGDVTQGNSSGFKAKGKFKFVANDNKIYDIKIDAEFSGKELKAFEKTHMREVLGLAKDGSTPFKMSFIYKLVTKIIKKARFNDKTAIINGVWFDNDKLEKAGESINSMNGLRHLIWKNANKFYLPFTELDPFTRANVYDNFEKLKELMPVWAKDMPLQNVIDPEIIDWYKDAYSEKHGTKNDEFNKIPAMYIKDRPDWKFVPLQQLSGSGFFCMTLWDNIGVIVDKPGEESELDAQKNYRNYAFMGDYKLGPAVGYFGEKVTDVKSKDYSKQMFWSNLPKDLLANTTIPQAPNVETLDVSYHNTIVLGEQNTAPTNVTAIDGATVGMVYTLKGDSDTNKSTIKNGGNLTLTNGDCVLTTKTTLKLLAVTGGKFIEVGRDVIGATSTDIVIAANATTVDISGGNYFVTTANTAATEITNLTLGIATDYYTITGGSSANATTITNGGNFTLVGGAMTLEQNNFIKFYYDGTKYIEVERG